MKSGVSKNFSKAERAVIRERSSTEAALERGQSFQRLEGRERYMTFLEISIGS